MKYLEFLPGDTWGYLGDQNTWTKFYITVYRSLCANAEKLLSTKEISDERRK
jgi:hypothetical protein